MTLQQARMLTMGTRPIAKGPRAGGADQTRGGVSSDKFSGTVKVAVTTGAYTASGLERAYHDKRTGEWKVRATGGRRTEFGTHTLHDHNVDERGQALGRRKQETNLFLTINTNRRQFGAGDPEAVKHAPGVCFKQRGYDILAFGPRHDEYKADEGWADAVIENMDIKAVVEVGPQTGTLHAHVWFRIVHWSQLQVDRPALQALFKEAYNERASSKIPPSALPACQIKLMQQSNWGPIFADYLAKQLGEQAHADLNPAS